jgi:hypothetical protein
MLIRLFGSAPPGLGFTWQKVHRAFMVRALRARNTRGNLIYHVQVFKIALTFYIIEF